MPTEPERYELFEAPPYQFHLNRRDFLEVAGFVICLTATPLLDAQTAAKPRARLAFAADGTVTVYSGKVDMGQGAATELAMAVAEELRLPLSKVRAVLGDTDLCPNDGITAGSRTTPATVPEARKAAAAHRGGELTPPANWTTLGKPHPALNGRAIVIGQHEYPSDIRRPGMLYAAVLRPPSFGARLTSLDPAFFKDKTITLVNDNGFVAVAAPTSFAARQAVAILASAARWETKPHPASADLHRVLKETAQEPRENTRGDLAPAIESAARTLKATYQTPYIQHALMEPRAAVAEWVDGKLTVWTGTQNPFGVQQQLQQNVGPGPAPYRFYGILCEPKAPGAVVRPYRGMAEMATAASSRLQVGIHGNPRHHEQSVYDSLGTGALSGYNNFGLDNRDRYYYRRVYLGCVRANYFLTSRPNWDRSNLAVTGGSQGGALSIVTAALASCRVRKPNRGAPDC